MITPIDVIDTGIKIGLGALISGAAAYWVAKLNHDRDTGKERAIHRRELLESVADSVQKYYHAVAQHGSFVEYIVAFVNTGNEPTESHYSELAQNEAAVIEAFSELTSAEAKLLLLNERESHKLLRAFHEAVQVHSTEYFRLACPDNELDPQTYSKEALEKYRSSMRERKDAFFGSLSSAYDRT